ncbi:hypothetical protein ACOJUR_00095 [Alicyclobacillus tolerans]|uniref:hypothetical protein n=1 Tax=Alicyclobacillus tolerans TaxID=90970 RepID=UPI003B7ABF7F
MGHRVQEILQRIAEGETREALMKRYGYQAMDSLNQYMRRHGYRWDRREQRYLLRATSIHTPNVRALDVMAAFEQPEADAKEIAKRLRFSSHQAMAQYMVARGYVWSSEQRNYVAEHGQALELSQGVRKQEKGKGKKAADSYRHEELLAWLQENREALEQLLEGSADLPRYRVPGVYLVKTLQISSELNQLLRQCSESWHMSQREIVEAALIQFFRTHGYQQTIQSLLGRLAQGS